MDVSPEMIEFCRSRHLENTASGSNDRMSLRFEVADAGDSSTMKSDWRSGFDLLTSFTALHWVPDQIKVLNNINFVLREGGLALLLIPVKAPKAFIEGGLWRA